MRNLVYMGILALALALAAPVSAAEKQPLKPKDSVELTGNDWLASSHAEKASFLLGVEMAFATEFSIAQRTTDRLGEKASGKKADKKRGLSEVKPSPFARGWMKAFKDTTRPELITKLDKYIEANPDQRHRHVFDIIWYEFIAPETKKARRAGGQ